ncbi:MAG: biopolymer transporter ExbD [Candidatus Sulfotelmatobacter sp.]
MLPKHTRSVRVFCRIDTAGFASIMVVLLAVMIIASSTQRPQWIGADLPRISHPVLMPSALREDALFVTVLRDGSVFFGADKLVPVDLAEKIDGRLRDRSVERKVYLRIDGRARYGSVKQVLDGIRATGIERVGILLEQPVIGR